ncbi:MAG: 2-iminoacetate synthase ThiH [Peptococcaceae bacterium]|jgi:2-iminoacetate synthase|nr:2-iminoacetate synthase ThiH [Peptococcaceae bacterium]MDH7525425.1 2-iminoacetate synthase ThiH [Peptococcaceae bacterium]
MSFYQELLKYRDFDYEGFFDSLTDGKLENAAGKEKLTGLDFLTLLSPKAEKHLEPLARKAHWLTVRNFGRTVLLFTPLYISNYCQNQCLYCGFNRANRIKRRKLTLDEVEEEARVIAATGLKHILLLTGDARNVAPVEYIGKCVTILKKYFASIAIEIFALTEDEYRWLVETGVDALTIYQETYNEKLYDRLHLQGPKKDFRFRLDAPERACRAYMRAVNIGALLGLDEWRRDAFLTGLHARYLQDKYPHVEISVSLPRLRPHAGSFQPGCEVSDKNIVQIMAAFRLFMPRAGITISTREKAGFRDNIIRLGVTKMSAGSTTVVGGRTKGEEETGQFEIADHRTVTEMKEAVCRLGYQPVFKDWHPL